MYLDFAPQYQIWCVVVDEGDTVDEVIEKARGRGAVRSVDGEEFCVQFPGRPQELYTEEALRRSRWD